MALNLFETPKYKLCFIGDSYVGKTSILNRIVNGTFSEEYQATIGLDFQSKNITINNKNNIQILLYDTAGQEKFRSLIPMYLRDSNINVLIYDISCKDSFNHLDDWLNEMPIPNKDNFFCCLIGNKSDLYEKREVTFEEGKQFAEKHNFIFQ